MSWKKCGLHCEFSCRVLYLLILVFIWCSNSNSLSVLSLLWCAARSSEDSRERVSHAKNGTVAAQYLKSVRTNGTFMRAAGHECAPPEAACVASRRTRPRHGASRAHTLPLHSASLSTQRLRRVVRCIAQDCYDCFITKKLHDSCVQRNAGVTSHDGCLLYTSPSPRD